MASHTEIGSDVTTLMLRNLPLRYRLEELYFEIVGLLGTEGALDFVYVPWDAKKDRNVGYGFINVAHVSWVQTCVSLLDNQYIGGAAHPCSVVPATLQGVEGNLRSLWQRVKLGCLKYWPSFILNGKITNLEMLQDGLDPFNVAEPAPWYPGDQSRPKRELEGKSRHALNALGGRDAIAPMSEQSIMAEGKVSDPPQYIIAVPDPNHDVLARFCRRWPANAPGRSSSSLSP